MTSRKTQLSVVDSAEAAFTETVQQQLLPPVQRLATHRDRIDLAVKELESERFDLVSRRDNVRRQAEALEAALNMHIADIEATMALYEGGLNSIPATQGA